MSSETQRSRVSNCAFVNAQHHTLQQQRDEQNARRVNNLGKRRILLPCLWRKGHQMTCDVHYGETSVEFEQRVALVTIPGCRRSRRRGDGERPSMQRSRRTAPNERHVHGGGSRSTSHQSLNHRGHHRLDHTVELQKSSFQLAFNHINTATTLAPAIRTS